MTTIQTDEIASRPTADVSQLQSLRPQRVQAVQREGTRPQAGADPVNGASSPPLPGVVTGTLIGFRDNARIPLVLFPGQRTSAAVSAATTVDVRGIHIGHQVVLVFEKGDVDHPIIVGLLRGQRAWPLAETPGLVEVDADGERVILDAKEQIVLRCGKASITLTKAGKVLIQGEYVSHTSTGLMRIKGGSVQVN